MSKNESIVYKDEVFSVFNTGKYYCSGRHAGKNIGTERLLHRRIWFENNGKIPSNHHIHHINGDWRDNRIENLECINRIDHQRNHMIERFKDTEFKEKNRLQLEVAQEQAKEWHRSEQGIAWHSKNAKECFKKRLFKKYNCATCKKDFYSKNFGKIFCCSLSCTTKYANLKNKTLYESLCRHCGTKFKHNNLIGRIKNKGCTRKCSWAIARKNSV